VTVLRDGIKWTLGIFFQDQRVCKGTNLGRKEFTIVSATARTKTEVYFIAGNVYKEFTLVLSISICSWNIISVSKLYAFNYVETKAG
jgi:hypothetical protein